VSAARVDAHSSEWLLSRESFEQAMRNNMARNFLHTASFVVRHERENIYDELISGARAPIA
jgi:hypothetical protein